MRTATVPQFARPALILERKDDPGNEPEKKTDPNPSAEVKGLFDGFMRTFEEFKTATGKEIEEIKKSGQSRSADVITADQVKKINDSLDKQQKSIDNMLLEAKRPMVERGDGTKSVLTDDEVEHKKAWNGFMRKGHEGNLRELEGKALSVGSDPDGGYLVPDEVETAIDRVVTEISPIRSIASVRQIGTANYKKPVSLGGAGAGWVGEASARPQTNTPTLAELEFPTMELYAMPAATQSFLDDARVNVEQWLADEVQITFAQQEGDAFINGNSNTKPKGFIGGTTKVAESSWAWGKIGYKVTGQSAGFLPTNPGDEATNLVDVVYSLKAAFRQNARWVMTRATQGVIRKFRDEDGNMIWQPGLQAGQPASLLGFGITEAEDMDEIGANSFSVAFGDFKRGYLIVDRMGVRVLRDPYTAKPYVLFYTTKRVGGGVQHYDAIKLLKFGTS